MRHVTAAALLALALAATPAGAAAPISTVKLLHKSTGPADWTSGLDGNNYLGVHAPTDVVVRFPKTGWHFTTLPKRPVVYGQTVLINANLGQVVGTGKKAHEAGVLALDLYAAPPLGKTGMPLDDEMKKAYITSDRPVTLAELCTATGLDPKAGKSLASFGKIEARHRLSGRLVPIFHWRTKKHMAVVARVDGLTTAIPVRITFDGLAATLGPRK